MEPGPRAVPAAPAAVPAVAQPASAAPPASGVPTVSSAVPAGSSQARTSRVASDLTGQVLVVADEDTNSLLVTVATRYADPVKQIIAELDRPRPQVLIKVLVAEVTHDDSVDFGVDFSIINRRANGPGITVGKRSATQQPPPAWSSACWKTN